MSSSAPFATPGDLVADLSPSEDALAPVREELLRSLAPKVYRWVRGYLGPIGEADDVAQEALIAVAGALERFEGRGSLDAYAHRIAIRVAARASRKRRRVVQESAPPPADEDALSPERRAMSREGLRRLYLALDRLSPKLRSAFVLCCVEGLGHQEAADVAGTSLETMRARLKRSRKKLRTILADDPYLASAFRSEGP
ncbi:MAG: RNA polymerase sigma factor [Myxococcota bacterium]